MSNIAIRPPKTVLAAMWLLALSVAVGFVRLRFNHSSSLTTAILAFAVLFLFTFAILRALYRGRNWARWLVVVAVLLGIALMPWSVPKLSALWEQLVYVSQGALQAVASCLLLVRDSAAWFRPNNSFKPKPLRGSA